MNSSQSHLSHHSSSHCQRPSYVLRLCVRPLHSQNFHVINVYLIPGLSDLSAAACPDLHASKSFPSQHPTSSLCTSWFTCAVTVSESRKQRITPLMQTCAWNLKQDKTSSNFNKKPTTTSL